MPNSIALIASATLAVAMPSPTPQPAPVAPIVVAAAQPAWRAVRADTIGDLLFTTQTLNGRIRFIAEGLKNPVPVTTADFTPDSVRAWTSSAAALAASPSPKMGDMRGLGMALTLNVTKTPSGESAFGFYVGDATTDQQVALALTKENVLKLTNAVNNALANLGH